VRSLEESQQIDARIKHGKGGESVPMVSDSTLMLRDFTKPGISRISVGRWGVIFGSGNTMDAI